MSTKTTAYGSITIVDITDVGEFSIYPMSNSPLSVVYDPDSNSYTPDWSLNKLELDPMIYYAGKKLDSNTTGLSVVWTRKDGVLEASELTSGESVINGKLTVSTNKLAPLTEDNPYGCRSGILTYICTASYLEPESNITLNATGQITFSLIKHASKVKKCSISGENIFKYNTEGVLINGTKDNQNGGTYIVLTAITDNVGISKWQYKSGDNWLDYPTTYNASINGEQLRVFAEENVFFNDMATIKITTTDGSVYDICTVVKLRDGAPGAGTVAAVLNNDDQWIPCDSSLKPLDGVFDNGNISSTITLLEGGMDVTSEWTITCTPRGASGSYDESTYTYTVSGISEPNATVEFKCEKETYTTIYKNFSLTKLKAGEDGQNPTLYSILPSTLAVNKTVDGVYTPGGITFAAYSKTGNGEMTPYAGRFEIFVNDSTTSSYKSGANESEYTYTLNDKGSGLKSIRCVLYQAGGNTETVLDTQTVVVISDGKTGETGAQGEKGESAINVVLGNQADIIPCNNDGSVKGTLFLEIPFTGYIGTTKTDCSVVANGYPTDMEIEENSPGSSSSSGKLKIRVPENSMLGNVNSGNITLTFTCQGSTVVHYYQWSKSIQALDGSNAVLFDIYAPSGNIIYNGKNIVTLKARLMDGSREITDETLKYTWYKYESGNYNKIDNVTINELIVNPSDVSGYASYRCTVEYGGDDRYAYYAVMDKTDPVQAQVHCSLGTQILNGQGYGAVYTKIYQNGEEIDAMKTEVFSTEAPQSGTYYYHLDTSNKTVTLMKYNGTTWEQAPDEELPKKTYKYTFRGKEGEKETYKGSDNFYGKVLYIDGDFVDKKIIIDVEVTV